MGKVPAHSQEEQQSNICAANSNGNAKRRIDILSTPQFGEVLRYVLAFNDPYETLSLLWGIADGPTNKEDLEMM